VAISRASNSSIQGGLPKFNDIWDGTTATSAFDHLATTLLSSSQSSISFSSIPQTYTHLQLRVTTRNDRSDNGAQSTTLSFNGDTTYTNYRSHILYYAASGANPAAEANQLSGYYAAIGYTPAANMTASVFGIQVIDILDYSNTSKNTTVRTLFGLDSNSATAGYIGLASSLWVNTAAVSSISMTTLPAANFVANTSVALYGIK
jgi:hypothetical protein